jgi:hypothetical protein
MIKYQKLKNRFTTLMLSALACSVAYKPTYGYNHTSRTAVYITATLASAATLWALVERSKKNTLNQLLGNTQQSHQVQLDHITQNNTIAINKLQSELDRYRSEVVQLEQDQALLASIGDYIASIEQRYEEQIKLTQNKSDQRDYLERIFALLHVQSKQTSIESVERSLKKDLEVGLGYKYQLEIKLLEWHAHQVRQEYSERGVVIVSKLKLLTAFLQELLVTLEEQRSVIILVGILERNYNQEYAQEIQFFQSNLSDKDWYHMLDKHIRKQYCDVNAQFPYLAYAKKIQMDREQLKNTLSTLANFKPLPFQTDILARAHELDTMLKTTFDHVVTSDAYSQEKKNKPECDRKEQRFQAELQEKRERLQAELKEKQERLEQEKYGIEIKLKEERNRTQQLMNEHAQLEHARRQMDVREQEMRLELVRMRDGETIKEALRKNNREWQKNYDNLKRDYDTLMKKKAELQERLTALEREYTDTNARIKNTYSAEQHLRQEISNLQNRIQRASEYVKDLQNNTRPPFNPDIVDGLRAYIDRVQGKANAAYNALS